MQKENKRGVPVDFSQIRRSQPHSCHSYDVLLDGGTYVDDLFSHFSIHPLPQGHRKVSYLQNVLSGCGDAALI